MDELADRPEPGNISAAIKAVRLQSLIEILPDGSPTTTTIAIVARRLRSRAEWHGQAGQRLNLDYVEKAVAKLVKAHPDLSPRSSKSALEAFRNCGFGDGNLDHNGDKPGRLGLPLSAILNAFTAHLAGASRARGASPPNISAHAGLTMAAKHPEILVRLDGAGDDFRIIGQVTKAMRRVGIPAEEIEKFCDEAMSGDDHDLLRICGGWVTLAPRWPDDRD